MSYKKVISKLLDKKDLSRVINLKLPVLWILVVSLVGFIVCLNSNLNKDLFFQIRNLGDNSSLIKAFLSISAEYLYIIIILIFIYFFILQKRDIQIKVVFECFVIGIIAYVISKFLGHIIVDIRPYIKYSLTPFISVAKDNGFPSDHTLISFLFTLIMILYYEWNKVITLIAFCLGCIVGYSRIFVGAHHPLDVCGSILIICLSLIIYEVIIHFLSLAFPKLSS